MQFDTSIYRSAGGAFTPQIESPIATAAKLSQLRQLQDAQAMSQLQRQQVERKLQREGELAGLYQEAAGDQNKLVSLLGQRGFFPEMQAIQKEGVTSQKTTAEAGKLQMETLLKKMQASRDALAGVNSDADMPAYKAMVTQIWGPDVAARTPERFDPNWKNSVLMTAEQHFQALQKQMDRDVTMRGQNMTADTARTGQGITMRGQDMTAATAQRGQDIGAATALSGQGRPQWDAERGVWVTPPQGSAPGGFVAPQGAQAPSTQAPGAQLPARLSENNKKELQSIDSQLQIIEGGLQATRATPSAFGMMRGLATMGGAIPETLAGRRDKPEEREARSYVYNIVSAAINERAGAAQSAQELARLRGFLPAETDNADQIVNKLRAFQQYLLDKRKGYETPASPTNRPQVERSFKFTPGASFQSLAADKKQLVVDAYEDPANHERLRQAGFIR